MLLCRSRREDAPRSLPRLKMGDLGIDMARVGHVSTLGAPHPGLDRLVDGDAGALFPGAKPKYPELS